MTQTEVQSSVALGGPAHRGEVPGASGGGWFADPVGQWRLRWWSGMSWTNWVSDGESVHAAPLADRRRLERSDLTHLAFVEGVFLPELAAQGGLTQEQGQRAGDLIRELATEAVEAPVGSAPPVRTAASPLRTTAPSLREIGAGAGAAGWVGPPAAAPAPAGRTAPPVPHPRHVLPQPVARKPGPLARWWQRTQESVRSDLAVHGVAYLGVLLFFVGAFGLVAFAFGDVQRQLRPVAEIVIAAVPFAAAALLVRRGAVIVGRALEVTGGLLLPVMVIASFLDGVGFPPDLAGGALALGITPTCALLTGAYAWWALGHRESALRYMVAPMAWLTAAMASVGLGRPIPSGPDVVTPGSAQIAVSLAALVASVAWARWAPHAHLAAPTCAAAVPGTVILGLLAALTWISEAQPWPAAILASGALGVAALELLTGRVPPGDRLAPAFTAVVAPVWWWGCVIALTAPSAAAWGFAVGALGFLVLIERAGRAMRPAWALAIPALGAVVIGLPVAGEPWLAVGVLAVASTWALLRRRRPFRVPGARVGLDVAALVLPLVMLAALAGATDLATALLAGAALLLLTTGIARTSADAFWDRTWAAWLLVVTAASVVVGVTAAWTSALPGDRAGAPWLLVASAAALTVAAALGPMQPVPGSRVPALRPAGRLPGRPPRVAAVVGLGSWTWMLTCWAGEVPDAARGIGLSVAALALVGAAHLRRVRGTGYAAALGASGHVLALAAMPLAGPRWGLVAVLALFTAGWAVTTVADARGASPVGAVLTSTTAVGRYVPPALLSAGIVATTLTGLWVANPDGWAVAAPLALSAIALAMAVASRIGLEGRPTILPGHVARTFAWMAFGLPVGALALAEVAWPQMVALVALIVCVLVLPAGVRSPGMTWTAWVAPAPLVGLIAREWSPAFVAQPAPIQAAFALVVVGSAMLLGAAVADLRFGPWLPRWRPSTPALVPPVVVGVAEGAVGVALLASDPTAPLAGWLLIGAAAALVALAFLSRIGLLAGVSAVVAWAGAQALITPTSRLSPLVAVAAVAILLALAELGHRLSPDRDWWSRWDVWVALAGLPIAAGAVWSAWATADDVAVDVLIGLLAIGTAVRVRTVVWVAVPLLVVGTGLVLIGAEAAGPWWCAGAVAGLAALLTAAAVRATGTLKVALQISGAVATGAAWASVIRAAEWTAGTAASLTLWGAGLFCLAFAGAAWTGRLAPSWVRIWGGLSGIGVVAVAMATWTGMAGLEPLPAGVGGLALLTAALLVAAPPLQLQWLGDAAAMTGLAALLTALDVLEATPTGWVLTLTGISVAAAIATLLLTGEPRRASIEVGIAATGLALAIAVGTSGVPTLLVAALAAGSIQAAAVGSALRSLPLQAMSPLLACTAWLAFAGESLTGQVEAWTMPIGLALLVVVGLWRRDRTHRGQPTTSIEIVAVEAVGVLLLVGASLVLMVTDSLIHVLPALVLGTAVATWGVVTRVRRRVIWGAATVVAAVLLLLAVPMVQLLPEWHGAGLWILLLTLGIAAMLVAALLEHGRAAARAAVGRFRDITVGWE